MTQGCPIYADPHFEQPISDGSGSRYLQTKRHISPSLKGTYLVLPLYPLTRHQINDEEDLGEAIEMQLQQDDNKRIARRIPTLIKSVYEKQNNHLMKIYGFVGGYDKGKAVAFIKDDSNMLDVTHVIYENCQQDLKHYVGEAGISDNRTVLTLAYQLILAVEHLHGPVGVMHRRLNPETVYVDEEGGKLVLKVGNILFARRPTNIDITAERNVPLAYAAPETLTRPGTPQANYGLPADIWSYGMVLYFITHGQDPFDREVAGRGSHRLYEHIKVETNRPELKSNVDPVLQDIITSCWRVNPATRPTASAIKDQLENKINSNHKE